ncbi:MAG: hypothetical protein WC349_04880 [Patescibacteria group bacterium]|jgi:hypothetical protein
MARIAILVIPDHFKLGLSDFVLFNPKVEIETCGLEGRSDKNFGVFRVEGEIKLVDDLIVIDVNWCKAGNFSFNQAVALMINVDGKTVWVNPVLCVKCMELNGKPVDDKNNIMRCDKGHQWEPDEPLIEVITTEKSRTD